MVIKLCLLFSLALSLLGANPVVNRYLPTHTTPGLARIFEKQPGINMGITAAHAAKASAQVDDEKQLHQFDGLLEIDGRYNLQDLIVGGKETITGYVPPFVRETGGDAWTNQSLLFGAKSSLSMYGVNLGGSLPLGTFFSLGFHAPFWHLEARQRYVFPITEDSQTISLPDAEQVRRFRQYVHRDLGLKPGDWVKDTVGDISWWAQGGYSWDYLWLFRNLSVEGRVAVSAPTGTYANMSYPSSIPVGNDGHWGVALTLLPQVEVKENIRLAVPVTVTIKPAATHKRRLSVFTESSNFGAITGRVQIKPGATLTIAPELTMEHLIDDLHFSLGFIWTHHYADTWSDMREDTTTKPSYLTRTTIPEPIPAGLTTAAQTAIINSVAADKKARTDWRRSYVRFDAQYATAKSKFAPVVRLTFDYCLSNTRAAKTHQITGQFSWRF